MKKFLIVLVLFFAGCKVELIDPVQPEDNRLNGVWNSFIHDSNYEYKSIILHLTQEDAHINGLGTYEEIPFDISTGNFVNNILAFNFTLFDTNIGDVKGTFRGNVINGEIHGQWQIDREWITYAIHFKPNNGIQWLPKYGHNQGGGN